MSIQPILDKYDIAVNTGDFLKPNLTSMIWMDFSQL